MLSLTNKYLISVPKEFYGTSHFAIYLSEMLKRNLTHKYNSFSLSYDSFQFSCKISDIPTKVSRTNLNRLHERRLSNFVSSGDIKSLFSGSNKQKTSPLSDTCASYTFDLIKVIPDIINSISYFEGEKENSFGISDELLYSDTIMPVALLMKNVDFGNLESNPLNFFYPVFRDYEDNIGILYNLFIKDLKEGRFDGRFIKE